MKKVGRNDPCRCGSGKKYKNCCLPYSNASEFQYHHSRQVHAGLIPKLIEFACENIEPDLFESAWQDFNDDETVEKYDPESPMSQLFMPWFLFNWVFDLKPTGSSEYSETTIAELFLFHQRKHITSDEQELLSSANRCPYSLCEVVEVRPGIGMTVSDLLRRITYEVIERSGSHIVKRGEIIYCATTDVGGFRSNVGTGPVALRPTAKRDVMDLRKWILEHRG